MRRGRTGGAFGPPGERLAEVERGRREPDRISLTDHVRTVDIGAFEGERGVPQRLSFDIAAEIEPVEAGDDVDRIVSYDRLAWAIDTAAGRGRMALLETFAQEIADRVLKEPHVLRVLVRIRKLDRGPGALGVEIVRERSEVGSPAAPAARPRVALLGAPALADRRLLEALHVLGGADAPVVLVAPAVRAPRARTTEGQRRLDLLAADQGAWLLAERDGTLAVAATLTEIDWHLRRRAPVVWAPSKLSLDEGWGDQGALERAIRFGHKLDAVEVAVFGLDLDGLAEAPVPVRAARLDWPLA